MADEEKAPDAGDKSPERAEVVAKETAKEAPRGDADRAKAEEGSTPAEPKPKGEIGEPKYTDAQVQQIVQARLNAEKEKANKAAEQARKDAEAKALKEQGQFRELAETRFNELVEANGRVADLEKAHADLDTSKADLAAKLDRYRGALEKQLAVHAKVLAPHIGELLKRLDPVEQLEWLAAHPEATAPAGPKTSGNGTPARPPAARGLTNEGPPPAIPASELDRNLARL